MPRKYLLIVLLGVSILINFAGALTPELGFDALWYHLTIPKLYLMWERIAFIPGGLLYYSAMPRLGEFLFIGVLKVFGEFGDIGAHLISLGAGIGTAFIIYKLARKLGLSVFYSQLSVLIFYITPLVGWLSGSAYIDLIRTFFETLSFYFLISGNLILAGVSLGLAISTKTLAIGSLGIFLAIITFTDLKKKASYKEAFLDVFLDGIKFLFPAILISAPWFIFSYLETGYPFYPIGAGILGTAEKFMIRNPIADFWRLFMGSNDPISPIYLAIVPLAGLGIKGLKGGGRIIFGYIILSFLIWFITPRTDWGRFILPYLPVWAIGVGFTISSLKDKVLKYLMVLSVLIIAIVNLGYRGLAIRRTVPYLTGKECRTEYLCKNLDFKTAVFVDCDGWFYRNIKPTDLVLVSGFHNLYYIDFPFVHESWYRGEKYNYILSNIRETGGERKVKGILVYKNDFTGALLYKVSP